MKILFAVCGEGLGHASRTTKLAKYLELFGHTCVFASYGKAYEFIRKQTTYQLFEIPREVVLEGEDGYFSISKTLWSSKGVVLALARSFFEIKRLLTENDIDLLIADTMYAAVAAARMHGIPAVFITNQNKFATAYDEDRKHWEMLSNVVEKYLVLPDRIIVPDFSMPNTISQYNLDMSVKNADCYRFTGPFMDASVADVKISKETVFASFGGEPFKLPMYEMLRDIADERPFQTFEVFSTTPGLPAASKNFRTYGYADNIISYMAKSRVAIMHGGLTSIHEALYLGKPVIMIIDPHHPEQWSNGRKMEEIGAGIVLSGDKVTKKALSDALDEALDLKVPDYSHLFNAENGCSGAMSVINDALKNHKPKLSLKFP